MFSTTVFLENRSFESMRFRLICSTVSISIASFVGISGAFAQTPASQSTPSTANIPRTITLDDAIKLAMSRNYSVQIAHNSTRTEELEVTRNKDNMWLPTVSASGSWNYDYSLVPLAERQYLVPQTVEVPTRAGGDTLVSGVVLNAPAQQVTQPAGSNTLSYGVTANLNLFRGGADAAHVNEAESTLGADQNNAAWTRQVTADNVTQAYLAVLLNNDLVDAADSTLAEALAQLSLVKGQFDAGVVPIVQFYQQDAVVEQDSLALIQAVNNYNNAKIALLLLLNIPPDEFKSYSFSIDGIDTSTSAASRAAVDTLISSSRFNAALDKRPDIVAQQQSIDASKYTVDATRDALYPSLNASVSVGGSGTNPTLSQVHLANAFSAGLTLSIPIFDAMQNRLAIDEAEIAVETQQLQLQSDVQTVRSQAATAVNNLQSASQALVASDAALVSAQEGLRLAEEQLSVGSGTEVSVVVAEATLESARTSRVNAKYNWVFAQLQLDYTLGKWNY